MATFQAKDAYPSSAHSIMRVLAVRTDRPDNPEEAPDQVTFLDRSLAAVGATLGRIGGAINNGFDRWEAAASSTKEAQKKSGLRAWLSTLQVSHFTFTYA